MPQIGKPNKNFNADLCGRDGVFVFPFGTLEFSTALGRNAARHDPGSTLVPSVGFGVPPKRTSQGAVQPKRASLLARVFGKSLPALGTSALPGTLRAASGLKPRLVSPPEICCSVFPGGGILAGVDPALSASPKFIRPSRGDDRMMAFRSHRLLATALALLVGAGVAAAQEAPAAAVGGRGRGWACIWR